jgi:N-acetylglucosaminyldiphosphoundecaprenol N-acetyl-beta-D-mannosaminyltransferase
MSVLNIPDAVRRITQAALQRQQGYICVTGVHGIIESRTDPTLRHILNHAFLCTPDGMPTVWMGRLSGHEQMTRVYGPDLMLAVMEATATLPIRHFLYGGMPGVAEELRTTLQSRYPGLQITGTYSPPFRPLDSTELTDLQNQVTHSRADILWVGLSTPKQERFMAEYLPRLDTSLMIGVGAAFDFHTGRVRQAPRWVQQNGLEWLYRLIQEPKRLWRRYLTIVPRFILLIALSRLLGHAAFSATGALLLRWFPLLSLLAILAAILGPIFHPTHAWLILGAALASLTANTLNALLTLAASEAPRPSILPALPWLLSSLTIPLVALGTFWAEPRLLIGTLLANALTLLPWLLLIPTTLLLSLLGKRKTPATPV